MVFPFKLLGLEIDTKLSFNLHVGTTCNTVTNWLNAMIHWRNYRTQCVESSNLQLLSAKFQLPPFSTNVFLCKVVNCRPCILSDHPSRSAKKSKDLKTNSEIFNWFQSYFLLLVFIVCGWFWLAKYFKHVPNFKCVMPWCWYFTGCFLCLWKLMLLRLNSKWQMILKTSWTSSFNANDSITA